MSNGKSQSEQQENAEVKQVVQETTPHEPRNVEDEFQFAEDGLGFSSLLRGDSLFRSIEAQLSLAQANSIFSNISPDELFQSNALSRQPSITGRPLVLQQEEKNTQKQDEL